MFSVIQSAREAAGTLTFFQWFEAGGFVSIVSAMWGFSFWITRKFGAVVTTTSLMDQKLDTHIENSPTLADCATQINSLNTLGQVRDEKTRDELLAVSLARDGEVAELEKRVRDTEDWQARRNGKDGAQ